MGLGVLVVVIITGTHIAVMNKVLIAAYYIRIV